MNLNKTYDYIIYSTSLTGVLTAIDLSRKNKSVLLLNFYGFTGGSLTESLNCYQIIDEKCLEGSIKILFDKIKSSRHGILYLSENEYVLNPEIIKIVLQEELENSKVDLLFHIVPFYLKQKQEYVEVSLTGKEGIFYVKGKTIVDASDVFELLKIENTKRSLNDLYYNLFLTESKDDEWQSFEPINKIRKLNNNRCWVSLKIPKPEKEFFIENASQKILNQFEIIVQTSGGRIQLIAPQSQKIYEVDKLKISDSIFHIKCTIKNKYSISELFHECSEL